MLLIVLTMLSLSTAGNDEILIYNAYINNDMMAWKAAIDRIQNQEIKSNRRLLQLVNYQYGYIAWCIGSNRKIKAKSYILLAEKNLAILERNNHNLSMVQAYKSAFYGYRIGLNTLHAPFIGHKSIRCAEQALKLDPENYFAYMQLGNIEYYMPPVFGGSIVNAINYYQKAKTLLEEDRVSVLQDWNYLQLLTIIAKTHYATGNYQSAKAY